MVLIIREYCLMVKQLSFKQPMLGSIPAILNINPPPPWLIMLCIGPTGVIKRKLFHCPADLPPLKKGGGDIQN